MKKFIFPSCLFFFIILTSQNCKKHNEPILYNTEFPNNIGTFWKYKVYDSISNQIDTVIITVQNKTILNNGLEATVWLIESLVNLNDTNYVTNNSDGIKIYKNKIVSAPYIKKYEFPLKVNKKWVNINLLDTSKVILSINTNIIAGNFIETYLIRREYYSFPGFNYYKEEDYFVNNIGLIKRRLFENSLGTFKNQTWELLSYQIN